MTNCPGLPARPLFSPHFLLESTSQHISPTVSLPPQFKYSALMQHCSGKCSILCQKWNLNHRTLSLSNKSEESDHHHHPLVEGEGSSPEQLCLTGQGMPSRRVPVIPPTCIQLCTVHCERGGGVECLMWLICHSTTPMQRTLYSLQLLRQRSPMCSVDSV